MPAKPAMTVPHIVDSVRLLESLRNLVTKAKSKETINRSIDLHHPVQAVAATSLTASVTPLVWLTIWLV
jgi:hypothetical protein